VTGLQTALDGKAATSHTHTIANVTGLQTALDGKAATSHSHAIADVTNLQTSLDGKAATSHTHTIANVTGLQTALDGKAATSHTHTIANVTGLQTALDGKSPTTHSHSVVHVDNFSVGATAQGGHLQWNRTAGDGKTWLLNNKGTGPGGITFGSITDAGVATERMTLDDSGNLEVSGFMELGAGAPQIKMKKLTGTTPTSGSMSSVAHGLSMNKILSADVLVNSGTGLYEPEHTGNTSGYTYSMFVGLTFIYIYLPAGTASSNIQSKPFSVLITYEL
jgi:hypothetical protein